MEGAIEMSRVFKDEELASDEIEQNKEDSIPEPMSWVKKRVKTQNRCFSLFTAAIAMAAVVYVGGGIILRDDEAMMEEYDAEEGIVVNGFDNAKTQKIFDKIQEHKKNGEGWWKSHEDGNPFGNENAVGHGYGNAVYKNKTHHVSQQTLERWNQTHPGQPFPFDNVHHFDHAQNGRGHNGNGHGRNHTHNGHGHGRNYTGRHPLGRNHTGESCIGIGNHGNWAKATITKADGKKYEVIEEKEHDSHAFTQGLTYYNGHLWESTGLRGHSSVRILDPETIEVVKKIDMDATLFGEGITWMEGNKLVQITWKSKRGFIYDADTLEQIDEFTYETTNKEGWGITWDPCKKELIVTDGTNFLHFWNPDTMKQKRKIEVTRMDGNAAKKLNEIEFWRGRVLANVWYEDVLLVIDPETGKVEKEYDFSDLWPQEERRKNGADVFNGISISEDPDVLYVTGKKWNRLFMIKLLH